MVCGGGLQYLDTKIDLRRRQTTMKITSFEHQPALLIRSHLKAQILQQMHIAIHRTDRATQGRRQLFLCAEGRGFHHLDELENPVNPILVELHDATRPQTKDILDELPKYDPICHELTMILQHTCHR